MRPSRRERCVAASTARFDVRAPGVTEVRPGTYVFYDATQCAHGQATFEEVAAWVVATVVSRPDALAILRDQASRRRGDTSIKSPHDISILDGFLGQLRSFKPAMAKRPPQPGDDELRQLRAQF